jgi:transcriptional regulator with XRE-family HTH domain
VLRTIIPMRIKAARDLLNLSQAALAKRCAISPSTLNELESGRLKDMRFSTLSRLSEELGVSFDWLTGRDQDLDQVAQVMARRMGSISDYVPQPRPEDAKADIRRKCMNCNSLLTAYEVHTAATCILYMSRIMKPEQIAVRVGLNVCNIREIIQTEMAHRRKQQGGLVGVIDMPGGRKGA